MFDYKTVRKRLKLNAGIFEHVDLDPNFPVSTPPLNVRGEVSPIPPHTHDCLEIGYCYDGSGIFMVEGKILLFKAGDVAIVNHREMHQMVSVSGSLCRWRFCYLDPLRLLAAFLPPGEPCFKIETLCGPSFINILTPGESPEICSAAHELIEEMLRKQGGYKSLVRSIAWGLLARLQRLVPGRSEEEGSERLGASREQLMRVHPAMDFIAKNYAKSISAGKLAKLCGLSPSRFRTVFREATGLPPSEYLVSFRMNVAATLLRNSKTRIIEIALASGYPTLSNFNRHFKKLFAISPRECRNRSKATERSIPKIGLKR